MIAKLFLAVGLVVGVALLLQTRGDVRRQAAQMKGATSQSADKVAHLVASAVEHAMLAGEGIQVKGLIEELSAATPEARIQVYDQRGVEVFAVKPPPPQPGQLPAPVQQALASGERVVAGNTIVRPIPSEQRCRECHKQDTGLRGVLSLEVDRDACAGERDDTLRRLVVQGFTHVMTARRSDLLDEYFAELVRVAPGLRGAAVYDKDGDLAFGAEPSDGAAADAVTAALAGADVVRRSDDAGLLQIQPLPMQDRCVACHAFEEGPVRGALALWLAPSASTMCDSGELEAVVDTSLRYIMLSRLGRRIADFLDGAAESGAVERLTLYDAAGRRYWTTVHPPPPAAVAQVLASKQPYTGLLGDGADERALVIAPMANERRCERCHGGSEGTLRGAVSVSLSTAAAAAMRAQVLRGRAMFSVGTLLAILIMLIAVLQYTVLRPVREIGSVADRVGDGKLDARVVRADAGGDEVARLGDRVNHMVDGLRTKTQLEKFVSKGTAAAAAAAGLRAMSREGERRAAAVLFSDIRGFTAFAETVPPEQVVEMLNRVLDAQARVVVACGGDIDKFVGDALMAVFQGDRAAARAAACAASLPAAVALARAEGESFTIGVGVAVGEVVYGAIGSDERMDFTVIGDVVNTAARLCSAADPDQVLVTEEVRAACGDDDGVILSEHAPLTVKGKRAPLAVFEVRPGGAGGTDGAS